MRQAKFLSFIALVAALWATPVALADECTIRQFGSNSFLRGSVTVQDLQALARSNAADIREALRRAGWDGNPDDLLQAIEAGQVEERLFPVGQSFEWMMFRRAGRPVVVHQRCYGGDAPFMGWEITVDSRGKRTTFAMPKVCGNLAMIHTERVAEVQEMEEIQEIEEREEETVVAQAAAPPRMICDLMVDEHHLKEEETLRVAVNVSDEHLVREVHLAIQREDDDGDDDGDHDRARDHDDDGEVADLDEDDADGDAGDSRLADVDYDEHDGDWKIVEEKTLVGPPFTWEGGLDEEGDYKLVAYSVGNDFRSAICEDRVEVD